MITLSALALGNPDWLLPVAITAGVGVLLVALSYWRTNVERPLRLACAALKTVGLLALLLCFLEPLWTGERTKPGANLIAVVADNSQSMAIQGREESAPRSEVLTRYLHGVENAWRPALAANFQVREFLADAQLRSSPQFADLDFTGASSRIGHSLRQLSERHRGQPLAGVLLFTDGASPDLAKLGETKDLPPVYPVLVANSAPARDIRILRTSVTQVAFEDAPVTVLAEVAADGFAGQEIRAVLQEIRNPSSDEEAATDKPVAEQVLVAKTGTEKMTFRFQLRPIRRGVLAYALNVSAVGEPPNPPEATLANNASTVTVDRGFKQHPVLYVGGRPSWEYKFLSRALLEDEHARLIGLIRIAKREPKFEFRGRAGETSNPLFRGFGQQGAEEVERYDQPVLIRLNTDDDDELRTGFPRTPEELFKYSAVIVDDLEAAFFTVDQMNLLQRFVSERGGGFLMLGGVDTFAHGKYARTPVGDMLPLYLDPKAVEPKSDLPVRISFTREGWLEPWLRLRPQETEEQRRLGDLPHFDLLNPAGPLKPAATVLAAGDQDGKPQPVLATQRFGRGRTAALLLGDYWQAGMGDEALAKDLGRSWRQMIRWLVTDVPNPVELKAEPADDGEGMILRVDVRDPKFQRLENAEVKLRIRRSGSTDEPVELAPEISAEEPGVYITTFIPRVSGSYEVSATATDERGAIAGQAQTGWTTDFAAAEFGELAPDPTAWSRLAEATGGKVLSLQELGAFSRDLVSKPAPVTEHWTFPLWHTPAMFLFALGCFVTEWGIRRWKGIP